MKQFLIKFFFSLNFDGSLQYVDLYCMKIYNKEITCIKRVISLEIINLLLLFAAAGAHLAIYSKYNLLFVFIFLLFVVTFLVGLCFWLKAIFQFVKRYKQRLITMNG